MLDFHLAVGDVILALGSQDYAWSFRSDDISSRFQVDEGLEANIVVSVSTESAPFLRGAEELFAAGRPQASRPGWCLLQHEGQRVLQVNYAKSSGLTRRTAVFDQSFSSGVIYIELEPDAQKPYPYPLDCPLDRLLVMNYLSGMGSGMFHGCAVDDGGRGYLFVGPQEAGKSTMARLWLAHSQATVLSDECVILRNVDGRFHVYGTPWAGGARAASPTSVPLERIFFISHGQKNQIGPKSQLEVVSSLVQESFSPFWDQVGMANIVDLCTDLSTSVPCVALPYVPTADVLDFIRKVA